MEKHISQKLEIWLNQIKLNMNNYRMVFYSNKIVSNLNLKMVAIAGQI
jgi:hypothetical protein